MVDIAIYADVLGTDTTSVPCREMLLELMKLRSGDNFLFVFMRGSQKETWWPEFRNRIAPNVRWREAVMRRTRKAANLLTLLGWPYQPDIDLEADLYLRLHAGTMGRRARPLIQTVTDLSALRRPRAASLKWHGRILVRRHLREGARLASRTVCISKFTADDVAAEHPAIASTLRIVPNGIADAWFVEAADGAPLSEDRRTAPYFVWYGQITPRKNIEGLIKAYALARRQMSPHGAMPDLLLITGALSGCARLDGLIRSSQLTGHVKFLPPQPLPRLVEYVSRSAGLVFPSFYEGFGMPIIEAFARGIPVLTSDVSAMPEVAGGHAVLCDPDDPASIAQGMIALLDPKQWEAHTVTARKTYAEAFTALGSAQRYSDVIDEVLGLGGRRQQ